MKYDKPHLSYDQQLALMRDRGLAVADHPRAIQGLKRIGYYRLSGYTFPLRTLEENPQQAKGKQQKRGETFIEGASFEDAVALHDFDHRLRGILLDGLQQLEVGLRVKIGYTLGKRGALAHLMSLSSTQQPRILIAGRGTSRGTRCGVKSMTLSKRRRRTGNKNSSCTSPNAMTTKCRSGQQSVS